MQFIDCGRALHIYTNGEAREFVRVDRMPNTYRRTEAQGGFALVVDYVQRTPRQLDVRWDFNGQATHPGSLTGCARCRAAPWRCWRQNAARATRPPILMTRKRLKRRRRLHGSTRRSMHWCRPWPAVGWRHPPIADWACATT